MHSVIDDRLANTSLFMTRYPKLREYTQKISTISTLVLPLKMSCSLKTKMTFNVVLNYSLSPAKMFTKLYEVDFFKTLLLYFAHFVS